MTKPISVKKPNRMILEYDNCSIELVASELPFKYFIFYTDEETMKRLEEKDVLAGPVATVCQSNLP